MMENPPTTFAALVRASMEKAGMVDAGGQLRYSKLAEAVECDNSFLIHIVAGRRWPETVRLLRIADAFGWDDATRALALRLVTERPVRAAAESETPAEAL